MKNHYQTLGLKRDASNDDIKKAYRKLAQKFHPDKNDGDKFFEERFKEIQEAYETLSDPYEKGKYDSNYDYFFNGQQKTGQTYTRKEEPKYEPVSALWNPPPQMNMESRGHIVGHLPELEEEMISWVPGQGESPNRVDALVWAATELVLAQRPSSDTLEGLGLNEDGIGNRWR